MQAIVLALMLPLILLNLLSGFVGGFWMAGLGEWGLLFRDVLYLLAGAFLMSFLMLPGIALALPAMKVVESGREKLGFVLGLPALIWTYAVVAISCISVFSSIMSAAEGNGIPYFLWAFAVASGPWSFLARKDSEGGNDYGGYTSFAAQLGMVSMFVAYLLDPIDLTIARLAWWFAPLLVLGFAMSALHAWVETRARRRFY